MKNLRKAALAVATASAVAFAGTSVAGAQTEDENNALTQISSEGESSLAGNEEGESSLAGKEEAESAPADEEQGGSSLSSDEQSEDASGSSNFLSRIGKVLGADQYVNGAQLWGLPAGREPPSLGCSVQGRHHRQRHRHNRRRRHCWHQRPEKHGPHQGRPVKPQRLPGPSATHANPHDPRPTAGDRLVLYPFPPQELASPALHG